MAAREDTPEDVAAQIRIIKHMNADHHDSIIRYLEHHHKLPAFTAPNSCLVDISLTEMKITAGQIYSIPFTPPLKSYREARERVTEMDREAIAALGRSDITIKEFVWPTGVYLLEFLIILATFVAYSTRWWFQPGGIVERALGSGFAKFSWTIQPWLLSALFVIHGTEVAMFIPHYLRLHSVDPTSNVFWLWVGFSFIEGQFAWMRFRELVKRKRVEKEKRKH